MLSKGDLVLAYFVKPCGTVIPTIRTSSEDGSIMNLEEAKKLLEDSTRSELRDHAFGDREVFWEKDGQTIATGYFGGGQGSVSFDVGDEIPDDTTSFDGEEARELSSLGKLGEIGRNDETGPDTFTEGDVMPGLSTGDVFHELTGKYLDES